MLKIWNIENCKCRAIFNIIHIMTNGRHETIITHNGLKHWYRSQTDRIHSETRQHPRAFDWITSTLGDHALIIISKNEREEKKNQQIFVWNKSFSIDFIRIPYVWTKVNTISHKKCIHRSDSIILIIWIIAMYWCYRLDNMERVIKLLIRSIFKEKNVLVLLV